MFLILLGSALGMAATSLGKDHRRPGDRVHFPSAGTGAILVNLSNEGEECEEDDALFPRPLGAAPCGRPGRGNGGRDGVRPGDHRLRGGRRTDRPEGRFPFRAAVPPVGRPLSVVRGGEARRNVHPPCDNRKLRARGEPPGPCCVVRQGKSAATSEGPTGRVPDRRPVRRGRGAEPAVQERAAVFPVKGCYYRGLSGGPENIRKRLCLSVPSNVGFAWRCHTLVLGGNILFAARVQPRGH